MTKVFFEKYPHLKSGLWLTFGLAMGLIIFSISIGKNELFLLFNTDLGKTGDFLFDKITYLGDGACWVLIAFLFWRYQRKKWLVCILAIVFSTLFTQLPKNYFFKEQLRPIAAIENTQAIHTVEGVTVHTAHSFPSGHTATAFTIFLLGCAFIRNHWVIPIGFAYALLVGYSRVYLAQHFPIDLAAGMLVAILTVYLSLKLGDKSN